MQAHVPGVLVELLENYHHSVRKRLNVQQLIVEALELWLNAKSDGVFRLPMKAESPWHAKLTEILASGDGPTIEAIKSNIDVFHDRLRRPAPAPVEVSPEVAPDAPRKSLPLRNRRPA